jgi:hypothetical protein
MGHLKHGVLFVLHFNIGGLYMTFWPFVLSVFAYMIVGSILGGIFDIDEDLWLWSIFWPIYVGFYVIVFIITIPFKAGQWVRKTIKKLNKKEKKV